MSEAQRFKLLEEIGRGGMATVYRAYDAVAESEVALKVLHRHMTGEAAVREAFLREAELMQALEHPAVVRVFGTTEVAGAPAIVMELVGGGDVQDLLAVSGPLEVEVALGIILPVLEVLQEAHEKGILHRDIKPQNVLLDEEGSPRLIDFGIGKAAEWVEVAFDGQVGTVEYMAPERIDGMVVDGRSDLYSVAVMLYELLCGELPFRGASGPEVMRLHRQGQVRAPREVRQDLSPAISAAVLRGLARFPEERYDSAEQMMQTLRGERQASEAPGRHGKWVELLESLRESRARRLDDAQQEEWLVYLLPEDLAGEATGLSLAAFQDIVEEVCGDLAMPDLARYTASDLNLDGSRITYLVAHSGIPLARGLSRDGAREMLDALEARGIRAHFGSRPRADSTRNRWFLRGITSGSTNELMIANLVAFSIMFGMVFFAFSLGEEEAMIPWSELGLWAPVILLLLFFACGVVPAAFSVGRAMEGIRFNRVVEDFLLDFRQAPPPRRREGVVQREHAELFEDLRSPRIKASYERFMNLALYLEDALRRREEIDASDRIGRGVRQAYGAVREILALESRLAGVGGGELTSRLRSLERQIAASTTMEETERLMEERNGLRERLEERELHQDRIQALAQDLLSSTSKMEALLAKVQQPGQRIIAADLVVLEFGAKSQYSFDELHAAPLEHSVHESPK